MFYKLTYLLFTTSFVVLVKIVKRSSSGLLFIISDFRALMNQASQTFLLLRKSLIKDKTKSFFKGYTFCTIHSLEIQQEILLY